MTDAHQPVWSGVGRNWLLSSLLMIMMLQRDSSMHAEQSCK